MASDTRLSAQQMIRATGARVTNARIRILATLLEAEGALTHADIESRLAEASGIDRVTVYRVLDWLVEQSLAHKISGDDRVWRFNAAGGGHGHEHAHFQCACCQRVICLDDLGRGWAPALPPGFTPLEIQLTVRGLCAECSPDNAGHDPGQHRHSPGRGRRGSTPRP